MLQNCKRSDGCAGVDLIKIFDKSKYCFDLLMFIGIVGGCSSSCEVVRARAMSELSSSSLYADDLVKWGYSSKKPLRIVS